MGSFLHASYSLTGLHDPRLLPYQDAIAFTRSASIQIGSPLIKIPNGNCLWGRTRRRPAQSRIRGRFWPQVSVRQKCAGLRPMCWETPLRRGRGGRRKAIGCRADRRGGAWGSRRAGLVVLRLPYPNERTGFRTPVETWRIEVPPVALWCRSVGWREWANPATRWHSAICGGYQGGMQPRISAQRLDRHIVAWVV